MALPRTSQNLIKTITISKLALILFIGVLCSLSVNAQIVITGQILNEEEQPLIGVQVVGISQSKYFAVTDIEGKFSLDVVNVDTINLTISYVGYQTKQISGIFQSVDLGKFQLQSLEVVGCGIVIQDESISKLHNFSSIRNSSIFINPNANIAESLNAVPGVYMHQGTFGTSRLTLRGVGSRNQFGTAKIKGYWNDIPLFDTKGQLGFDDFHWVVTDNLQVYRGPSPVQYGSSLGGMLHLRSVFNNNDVLLSEISVGSFGLLRSRNRLDIGFLRNRIRLRLGYSSLINQGFRENNQYNRSNLSGIVQATLGKRSECQIQVFSFYTDVFGEIPSSLNVEDFTFDPSLAAANWKSVSGHEDYNRHILGSSIQYNTLNNWLLKLNLSRTQFKNDEIRPFNNLNENASITVGRLDIKKEELLTPKLTMDAGVEWMREQGMWETSLGGLTIDSNADVNDLINAYAQFTLKLSKVELMAGLNGFQSYNYIYDFINGPSTFNNGIQRKHAFVVPDHLKQSSLSPNLRMGYRLGQNELLYIAYAKGYGLPTNDERFNSDESVNVLLGPEVGQSVEVGYKDYDGRVRFDISAYYMNIEDLLVPFRISEEQTIGINAGKTRHLGIEATFDTQFDIQKTEHQIKVSGTYGRYQFLEYATEEEDYRENHLPGLPNVQGDVVLLSTFGTISSRIHLSHIGSQFLNDTNALSEKAYTLTNVSLSWNKQIFADLDFHLSVGMNNTFNSQYASMILVNARGFGSNLPRYYYPGLPRNIFGTLKLIYQLR